MQIKSQCPITGMTIITMAYDQNDHNQKDNNKYGHVVRVEPSYIAGCKMVQPLWKTVWQMKCVSTQNLEHKQQYNLEQSKSGNGPGVVYTYNGFLLSMRKGVKH